MEAFFSLPIGRIFLLPNGSIFSLIFILVEYGKVKVIIFFGEEEVELRKSGKEADKPEKSETKLSFMLLIYMSFFLGRVTYNLGMGF